MALAVWIGLVGSYQREVGCLTFPGHRYDCAPTDRYTLLQCTFWYPVTRSVVALCEKWEVLIVLVVLDSVGVIHSSALSR